jgi:TRAP-type mannitol/chloroaromatic compound transport system permease small subunit
MREPPRPDHVEPLGNHLGAPVRAAGALAATLLLLVVAIVLAVVVLRYGVGWGRIWLQELYVWLAAAAFMLAAASTMASDGHVRIDIVYARRGPRYRALVDLLGCVLLLGPFLATIIVTALPYVRQSWAIGEASREAGGLPGVFVLKSLILAFAGLLAWQGLLLATRSLRTLLAGRT